MAVKDTRLTGVKMAPVISIEWAQCTYENQVQIEYN